MLIYGMHGKPPMGNIRKLSRFENPRNAFIVACPSGSAYGRKMAVDSRGLSEVILPAPECPLKKNSGAINLNVHLHSLVVDGVYYMDAQQKIQFQRLPKPSDSEVAWVMERVVKRIIRLLERRGLGPQADPDEADPLLRDQPLLAELYSASVQGRIAIGPRAGNRVAVMGIPAEPQMDGSKHKSGCVNKSGFSLHSSVSIPEKARRQLENLCRYVARPAVATERLSLLPDGRVAYNLRHKWRNGATSVLFEPLELMEKLAALVPPPRFNLVRYSGGFAPASPWRSQIVPFNLEESDEPVHHTGCEGKGQSDPPCQQGFS
jgi:hypothetical protein